MNTATSRQKTVFGHWSLGFGIFLVALAVNAAAAWFVQRPGYMDAYYYFGGAKRLAQGYGFTEPYLWNYLDNPTALPHPSHLYWMPLTSMVASLAMMVCGRACPDNASLFRAAQIPSVLLASLLPLVSYYIAARGARLEAESAKAPSSFFLLPASFASWFTLFPAFYFAYWPNTDAFALYGLVGSLALLCAGLGVEKKSARWFVVAGLFAGLGHLARADGVLLSFVVLYFAARPASGPSRFLLPPSFFLTLLGYFVITLPWFLHNLAATGSLLAPGGTQALWFTTYNDLFNYPADLTPATYLAQGWGAILAGKWEAVKINLQTALAAHGLIALAPFIVVGLWSRRRAAIFQPAILYALGLYLVMTFVFTFPGTRGGLFHSGAALLPFYFAAAPIGLERAVAWIAARRSGWHAPTAARVFLVGLAVIAAALTAIVFARRVVGPEPARPAWNRSDEVYQQIGVWLLGFGDSASVVVVNNPPAFYYFTDHPAVVIPNGDRKTLLAVAERYDAKWVVIDANVPDGLRDFYTRRESDERLRLAAKFTGGEQGAVFLYEVIDTEAILDYDVVTQ